MSDKHLITVSDGDPLIGIPGREKGQTVTHYFTDEAAADEAMAQDSEARIERALSAIGTWSHLDWEAGLEHLDRIRRESTPTPAITLDR